MSQRQAKGYDTGTRQRPRYARGSDPRRGASGDRPRDRPPLHAEYYGQGPTRAKTYITEDLVVVLLEETFTPAERTLVEHGDKEPIEQIRRRFQVRMGQQFTSVVEQATGRKVKARRRTLPLARFLAVVGALDEHWGACRVNRPTVSRSSPNARPREAVFDDVVV
jgi:hypothetical protein